MNDHVPEVIENGGSNIFELIQCPKGIDRPAEATLKFRYVWEGTGQIIDNIEVFAIHNTCTDSCKLM